MLRRLSKHSFCLPYMPVVAAPFILFAPVYLRGQALFWGTPSMQFVPWWWWAFETVKNGSLPLWNPQLGMGAPLVANYQSALFYPPNWLYLLLAAVGGKGALAWGMAPIVALHLIWAGIGMILLVRKLELGVLAQAVAGLAFSLSGYLVARAGFLSITSTVSWMPWIILGVHQLTSTASQFKNDLELSAKSRRMIQSIIGLALAIGMMLLAGHAQTAWYILVLSGVWLLYVGRNNIFSSIGGFALAGFMGVSLASVQLLPTAEYLLQSHRAGAVDFEFAMTYSFWPWRILGLIAPDLFGNPALGNYWGYAAFWEDAIYIGLLPLTWAFSILATFFKRRGLPRLLSVLLPVILLLALGDNTPVFPWLYRNIPTFDMFQAPTRWMIIFVFALSLLAAYGVQSWHRPVSRKLYWTRLGSAGALAITIGSALGWFLLRDSADLERLATMVRAMAMAGLWAFGTGVLSLLAPAKDTSQEKKTVWQWVVVAWVGLDLLVAGWGLNPGIDLSFYSMPSPLPDSAIPLGDGRVFMPEDDERQIKFERFFRFDTFQNEENWKSLRNSMLPNLFLLDSISSANNFDPLVPYRFARWMETYNDAETDVQSHLLNLMNVNLVMKVVNDQAPGISMTRSPTEGILRWYSCALVASDSQDALALVTGSQTDKRFIILENVDTVSSDECVDSEDHHHEIVEWKPDRLVVDVSGNEQGWLFWSETLYPSWQTIIDGKPVDTFSANYLFQAVQVPAGASRVEFLYRPRLFYLGLFLSVVTWIGFAILFVYSRRKYSNHN